MHGLVSLGMLEKPHLIHSSGEGAYQESPHTSHSFAIACRTYRLPSQHTQTFVCPLEGPHRDRLKAGHAGENNTPGNSRRNSDGMQNYRWGKGHAGPLVQSPG